MCPGRISIHASCKGSDHSAGWCRYPGQYFNPRFPRRKRLNSHEMKTQFIGFQSTLPAGEATLRHRGRPRSAPISIHASRGGSDRRAPRVHGGRTISIHASRGGSDAAKKEAPAKPPKFQSTLPAGEATFLPVEGHHCLQNFNPRFPRGKRRQVWENRRVVIKFQSTLPAGEATLLCVPFCHRSRDFNPRFPRGKRRRIALLVGPYILYFNPRFPRGKRPAAIFTVLLFLPISIHASRGGSDQSGDVNNIFQGNFNPRFPRGKRHF